MGAGAIPIDIEKAFKERAKNKHKLTVYMADEGYDGEGKIDLSFCIYFVLRYSYFEFIIKLRM